MPVAGHVVDLVHLEHGVQGAPGGLADEDVRLVFCESAMRCISTRHADQRRAVVQTVDLVLVTRGFRVVVRKTVPIANIAVVVRVLDLPLRQVLRHDDIVLGLRAPACRGWQLGIPHTHRPPGDRGICGGSNTPCRRQQTPPSPTTRSRQECAESAVDREKSDVHASKAASHRKCSSSGCRSGLP